MRRSLAVILGLAALGTGIWLIVTEHAKNTVCNTGNTELPGITSSCQGIVWSYYVGFVLIGAGVLVLGFALLMKTHERKRRPQKPRAPELSVYGRAVHHDSPILWSAPQDAAASDEPSGDEVTGAT